MSLARKLIFSLIMILAQGTAQAHKPSDSYLHLSANGTEVSARWEIALRDLNPVIDLDGDLDGKLQWREVRNKQEQISQFALAALTLKSIGQVCAPSPVSHAISRHSDGAYAVLSFTLACAARSNQVDLSYRLFTDIDPSHRVIVRIGNDVRVLTPGNTAYSMPLSVPSLTGSAGTNDSEAGIAAVGAAGSAEGFFSFIRTGLRHVLNGADHLAFLICLLLPAVLQRRAGRWVAAPSLRRSAIDLLRIITAFTVAHSITLLIAGASLFVLSPSFVEPAIAASVVFAGVNNLYPMVRKRLALMAFAFGLIHGFGFAAALHDAQLAGPSMVSSLLGFNVGVELGQLFIAALFLPIAWWLRTRRFYPAALLPAGSAVLAAAGLAWFIDRVFDLRLLPI